ncbi:MAG: penicillin acylase family protein [Chitinophagaceae bacterium]|nr:penicillin acylase family protein [Chitinophagaceae bacterium]
MRFIWFFLSATITTVLIFVLNTPFTVGKSKTPRLGMFLSPQKGFWQNAEAKNASFNESISLKGLKTTADVYFDDRLVPHIYAKNSADAYFVQGFLHAKFRLWQMDFQTYVAGGRLSEIRGKDSAALAVDKYFRRMGMVYAAENAMNFIADDDSMKQVMNAYTAGVNAYINQLKESQIPLEYKLLDYQPEPWTNLKTALFLKLMSFDLTGRDDDIVFTNAKTFFGYDDFMKIFPNHQDSLDPIIPKGTAFQNPSVIVKKPSNIDSAYLIKRDVFTVPRPVTPSIDNGSNNWVVGSSKTKNQRPILCNDPHLGLNLPSLWYEMQITTPEFSTYGATFPGSPAVIIGFNNDIAWGVTNAGRDVKDYYELEFKDSTLKEYWFNGDWKEATIRNEVIKIKGSKDSIVERIAITDFGVVMYDKKYQSRNKDGKYIAVRWTAHDPSNELKTFVKLNSAKNYQDYKVAISNFVCPGQNFAFAAKNGDIAMTQQGKFVAKWNQQGDFLMPGSDSSFMWQGFIPNEENPYQFNPARGFVSSANQKSVDSTYPYYLGRAGNFPPYRGLIINRILRASSNITVDDMKSMQTNNYNVFAETALPLLLKNLDHSRLNKPAKDYIELLNYWKKDNVVDEKPATFFQLWWDSLDALIFDDEFLQSRLDLPNRLTSALIDNIIHDSTFKFIDNIYTPHKETLREQINLAFTQAVKSAITLEKEGKLAWGKFRETSVMHQTKLPQLSKLHINTSGSGLCINATKETHGPSWRMIVSMTDEIEAYAIYPGGQSGNPGSYYYDNFIDSWAQGKYYKLLFLTVDKMKTHKNMKWHMKFSNI